MPPPNLNEQYTTLRLILGDQLNAAHSWYKVNNKNTLYVIAELHQEMAYTTHHAQKIAAFFLSMQNFAQSLHKAGHNALHITLDNELSKLALNDLIESLIIKYSVSYFDYQRPDEYRLCQQLEQLGVALTKKSVAVDLFETEHFLLPFEEISTYFKADQHNRMETFYRKMRKRLNILLDNGEPEGGKWNYDASNRSALKAADIKAIPTPLIFSNDASIINQRLKKHNVKTLGQASDDLLWPVSRQQSRKLLKHFCKICLPSFGKFQDAMTENSPHSWSLYHSRLSFSLNSKILSPGEVIKEALNTYHNTNSDISIEQIEGFIRQIIGWREYVRGTYWVNQPHYKKTNALSATQALPDWYWTGDTKMRCLSTAIKQSLEFAYAHHIQRLMVTGNFALIAGINPDEVEDWYLGIYVDAIEWVEQPNTRSMVLFADKGWVATKPYAASGNYINKMSDHCKNCHYAVKKKTEPDACPLNSLYWHFLHRNRKQFEKNPRMAFPYKAWQKMDNEQQRAILKKADSLLDNLNAL